MNTNFLSTKGIIALGDVHHEEDALDEIDDIIDEVCEIGLKNNCDLFIQLGDLCDKNRLDAHELFRLVKSMIKIKNKFKNVLVIEGNHDKKERQIAIINFLSFLNIGIYPDEVLLETPFGKMLCGHWFVDKSKDAFGTHHKYTVEALKEKYKFNFCLLGHQHDYQKIDNIYHVGSARYVSFGENENLNKKCVVINNNGFNFFNLKSVIPIYNIDSVENLAKVPNKAKVRYIFRSFSNLKEDLEKVNSVKDRFYSFKKKLDFSTTTNFANQNTTYINKKSQDEIVKDWLSKIEDTELRNILQSEFVKEFKL